jgi:hypothetical protein
MRSRPGCRAERHYPATPGMVPRPPVHVILVAAGSGMLSGLQFVSFFGLRRTKRSIICGPLAQPEGQVERLPTVLMLGLYRRLQRLTAGSVAAGIEVTVPADCESSVGGGSTFHEVDLVSLLYLCSHGRTIRSPLVLPVLAPALGVILPVMVHAGDGDLLLQNWDFHHDWMGWRCEMHVR